MTMPRVGFLFYKIRPRLTGQYFVLGIFVRHSFDGFPLGRGSLVKWAVGAEIGWFGIGIHTESVMQ